MLFVMAYLLGSMNWMAPEVFDHAYDERSDIWSVGCILLEMVTCGFIARPEEIAGKLFEIKHNSKALDALMETVSQVSGALLESIPSPVALSMTTMQ